VLRAIAVIAALNSACVADHAIRSRHTQPRMATPAWRVYADMTLMAIGGAIAIKGPDGPHLIGFGAGLGVWAVDLIAVIATGQKD